MPRISYSSDSFLFFTEKAFKYIPYCFSSCLFSSDVDSFDSSLSAGAASLSAAFFSCVPPDAGDSLELKLVGLVGGGLETDKRFVSRVEGVRTNLVADVDLVISAFRAANQRVA